MSITRIFSELYEKRVWGDGVVIPLSGGGSSPEVAEPYVRFVERVIREHAISSVVDIGHGDWMMWRDYKFPEVNYFGLDAVESLSQRNNELYGSKKITFQSADATEATLPQADLLISKEVLQHLSNENVLKILSKINNFQFVVLSNAIHLSNISAAMSFVPSRIALRSRLKAIKSRRNPFFIVSRRNNIDIRDGDWRALDLEVEPFRKPFQSWALVEKIIYPGSNYRGVVQAIYLFKKR